MTPQGEAMMARDLGLDQEIATEILDNKPATDFHNNVRIWEQVNNPTRESFKQAFPTVDTEVKYEYKKRINVSQNEEMEYALANN